MSNVEYRFQVYSTGGSTVAHTFQAQLASIPSVGQQVVRFTEGRTESVPWAVDVLDASTAVTAVLADSSGRMTLLNRLAEIQRRIDSTESTAWTTLGIGRITDIPMNSDVASYQFLMEDERTQERRGTIWTTGATSVYLMPPQRRANYGDFLGYPERALAFRAWIGHGVEHYFVSWPVKYSEWDQSIIDSIIADKKAGVSYASTSVGNFNNLRLRILYTGNPPGALTAVQQDYEIRDFPNYTEAENVRLYDEPISALRDRPAHLHVAVEFLNNTTAVSMSANTAGRVDAYLYFATPAAAAFGNPYFLGSSSGIHPMQLLQDVLDGTYGGEAIRYSTAAFDDGAGGGLLNDPTYGLTHWIITEPANEAAWLETNIYQPYQVIPFIDEQGRVAPKSVALPNSDTVDPNTLFTFTAASLSEHPTWMHSARDIVTVLRVHYLTEVEAVEPGLEGHVPQKAAHGRLADHEIRPGSTPPPPEAIIYGIETHRAVIEKRHDRVDQYGERVLNIQLNGVHKSDAAERAAEFLSREFFQRFGDGPMEGTLKALSTAESVDPGDFAKVTLATFPNPNSQARGGTRIVQVLSRAYEPDGPAFTWLDAGPDLAVLSTPTITLAVSTTDARHYLEATLGTVSTAGTCVVQIAQSTASSIPGSTSSLWRTMVSSASSSGVYAVGPVDSGSYFWGRARNHAPQRIRSEWGNSTVNVNTSELDPPDSIATSSVTQGTAVIRWNYSTVNADSPVEVLLDDNSALDTFTDTTGTVMSAHTPNSGFLAWSGGASTSLRIVGGNVLGRTTDTTGTLTGTVRSSGDIANDHFSYSGYFTFAGASGIGQTMGIIFRSNATGSTGEEYQRLRLTYNNAPPLAETLTLGFASVVAGVATSGLAVATLQAPPPYSYTIGVVVSGQTILPFIYEGTTGSTTFTATTAITSTYFNDTGHQRMGISVESMVSTGDIIDTIAASLSSDAGLSLYRTLPAGSDRLQVLGLSSARSYQVGVRHHDPFPLAGVSATTSLTFTPTTEALQAPAIGTWELLVGTSSS